jgi:opacity protein-like surface antigen
MRLSTFLLGGVTVLGLGSAAFAADLIIDEPVAPAVLSSGTDWSGFYAGAFVGFGSGTLTIDAAEGTTPPGGIVPIDQDVEGWLAGAQVGFNLQDGSLVYGLNADLAWSGISATEAGGGEGDRLNWVATLTGRAGVAFDTVLLYGKAGLAIGEGSGFTGPLDDEAKATHIGWVAGVGAEVALTDSVSLFAEYNYIALGSADYEFPTEVFPGADTVSASMNVHAVKAGLNFAF